MQDGSDAVSDWPLLNALLNTAGGATWVSLHHGGGVGMGRSGKTIMFHHNHWWSSLDGGHNWTRGDLPTGGGAFDYERIASSRSEPAGRCLECSSVPSFLRNSQKQCLQRRIAGGLSRWQLGHSFCDWPGWLTGFDRPGADITPGAHLVRGYKSANGARETRNLSPCGTAA